MNARARLALRGNLAKLGSAQLKGASFWRYVDERYAYASLGTFASHIFGNRYNRGQKYEQPSFGALYLADTPANALEEIKAMVNGVPKKQSPRRLLCVDVALSIVVDIRSVEARTALSVTIDNLKATWELKQVDERTMTQEIGAAAYDLGVEALLVPSAITDGAYNIVVIDDNLLKTSILSVFIEDKKARVARDQLVGRR